MIDFEIINNTRIVEFIDSDNKVDYFLCSSDDFVNSEVNLLVTNIIDVESIDLVEGIFYSDHYKRKCQAQQIRYRFEKSNNETAYLYETIVDKNLFFRSNERANILVDIGDGVWCEADGYKANKFTPIYEPERIMNKNTLSDRYRKYIDVIEKFNPNKKYTNDYLLSLDKNGAVSFSLSKWYIERGGSTTLDEFIKSKYISNPLIIKNVGRMDKKINIIEELVNAKYDTIISDSNLGHNYSNMNLQKYNETKVINKFKTRGDNEISKDKIMTR